MVKILWADVQQQAEISLMTLQMGGILLMRAQRELPVEPWEAKAIQREMMRRVSSNRREIRSILLQGAFLQSKQTSFCRILRVISD